MVKLTLDLIGDLNDAESYLEAINIDRDLIRSIKIK